MFLACGRSYAPPGKRTKHASATLARVRENLSHQDVWTAVTVIAGQLIARGELTGQEVEDIALEATVRI